VQLSSSLVNSSAVLPTKLGLSPAGLLYPKANNQHIRFRGAFKFTGEQSEAALEEGQLWELLLSIIVFFR